MAQERCFEKPYVASHIPHSNVGSYPLRYGNFISPLVDGEPAFRRICQAVEAARYSVWVTVAFIEMDFQMPDGRGSLFDVLERAQARGLDVRVIFWRINDGAGFAEHTVFSGSSAHRSWLQNRGSRFLARWDRAQKHYCHHQKTWLIDAGQPSEIAFVGGINLDKSSMVSPGHSSGDGPHTHDVYVEVRGPAATDVHHNFVQRWNEASERTLPDGGWPDGHSQSRLDFPRELSAVAGQVTVQIQRTVRPGHYTDSTATPGGKPFPIQTGELTLYDQYLKAIDAARRTIYIENQALASLEIVQKLDAALARGVEVVFLMPADANAAMSQWRARPQSKPFFDQLAALGRHPNFTLAGIAAPGEDGALRKVYVHAKVALIDDSWATIGSCNVANRAFFGDTELNASFWDPEVVRNLRCELLREHLAVDTSTLDDQSAFALYRNTARDNLARYRIAGSLAGLVFALDPATYAT